MHVLIEGLLKQPWTIHTSNMKQIAKHIHLSAKQLSMSKIKEWQQWTTPDSCMDLYMVIAVKMLQIFST